jgi:hypothetical protein
MLIIRSAIILFALNGLAMAQLPQAEVLQASPWKWDIQFAGNEYYNADSLRIGLMLDRAMQLATVDQINPDLNSDLIHRRILRGYLGDGFRDAKVSTVADTATHTITATIEEGVRWKQRKVIVTGLSPGECEYVASLLKHSANKSNPLQESKPSLTYWSANSAMSFLDSTQSSYHKTVAVAMTEIGCPEAEFTIRFSAMSEVDKHSVDLEILVSSAGPSLTIGDINFTGLEKHTPEQLIEFLELKSGMPLSLMLREQIVSKLLKSGRFLMAEVTYEPFLFDPAEPLDLDIRVREYDQVAPLGEELTEVQQTLMKTSDWLSKWGENCEDLHLKISASNGQANEVIRAFVPQQYHSFCDLVLGTGTPGTLCIDFLTSPKVGSVLTLQVIDAQGTASMRRTILLTNTAQGLVAWQNKKKWLQTDQMSITCIKSMLGQWGDKNDRRAVFRFGYGINSNLEKGLKSEFQTTAAAVIHMVNYGTPEVLMDGDLCRLTWEAGKFEFNRETGAIRNISATTSNSNIVVSTGNGLVAAELDRLMEETRDWENQCQQDQEWPALAAMILEDVRTVDLDNSGAIGLLIDLLSNDASIKHLSKGLTLYADRHDFHVPQQNTTNKANTASRLSLAPMLVRCAPGGSFPHRLGLAWFESENSGNKAPYARLVQDLLKKQEDGAIYCELMARIYPESTSHSAFAKAGLERLSTEAFQCDMAPFINEPGAAHELICALVVWLQGTSDENAEKLAALIAKYYKDKHDQPVNIRPILAVIRSQRDKSAGEVLASLVPVIWERGLQAWVEADLRALADAAPTDTKKYFNTPALDLFKTMSAPTSKTKKSQEAPIKPISRTARIKDINFDEQWDLDK